jgi:hypothetical protein
VLVFSVLFNVKAFVRILINAIVAIIINFIRQQNADNSYQWSKNKGNKE